MPERGAQRGESMGQTFGAGKFLTMSLQTSFGPVMTTETHTQAVLRRHQQKKKGGQVFHLTQQQGRAQGVQECVLVQGQHLEYRGCIQPCETLRCSNVSSLDICLEWVRVLNNSELFQRPCATSCAGRAFRVQPIVQQEWYRGSVLHPRPTP